MRLLRIWLVLISTTLVVQAQTNSELAIRPVTLQDCIQMALEKNLGLQVQRYGPRIAGYNLGAAYAGYDPVFFIAGEHTFALSGGGINPGSNLASPVSETEADVFRAGLNGQAPFGFTYNLSGNIADRYGTIGTNSTDTTRGQVGISMTQPLLRDFWMNQNRLNILTARNRVAFADEVERFAYHETISRLERAYYDLIAARENVKVRQAALRLASRLLEENRKRVEVGAMTPLDEQEAQSQVATSRADLIEAQQRYGTALNLLRAEVTDDYTSLHNVILDPVETLSAPEQPIDLYESWGIGLRQRPDLIQMRLDLEREGIVLKYHRNQRLPAIDLIGSYGHEASGGEIREFSQGFRALGEGSRPFYSYGAQLSVPLSNKGPRERFKASRATVEQFLLRAKQMEQTVLREIDEAVGNARATYERVGATREARVFAEYLMEAEEKKLQSGKSTSYLVLQYQRDLTDARSREITALAEYNKSLTELARAEGTTLQRRQIGIHPAPPESTERPAADKKPEPRTSRQFMDIDIGR